MWMPKPMMLVEAGLIFKLFKPNHKMLVLPLKQFFSSKQAFFPECVV